MGSFGGIRFIPVRPGARRVHSSAFDPFPCALVVVVFVKVSSAESRPPLGSFQCVWSIPTRHDERRVRFGAFGPLQFVLRVVGFVRLPKVH